MVNRPAAHVLVAILLILATVVVLRLCYILPSVGHFRPRSKRSKYGPSHIVIVLGSGGHTAEMMSLMRSIDPTKYTHRTYIVSSGDSFSSDKAYEIEKIIQIGYTTISRRPIPIGIVDPKTGTWDIRVVPRARNIHQSLYTSPISSLKCMIGCLQALYATSQNSIATPHEFPDVILTNGPATAVIIILAAALLRFLAVAPVWKMKIIYVESWARVKTLSLSGKILLKMGICDRFLVQWEALAEVINGSGQRKRVDWVGFLVE